MGEVYRAYDRRLDRRVAVKLIRPEHTESPTARERFRREARAAAGLSHPSIVQIHDIVEAADSDAIVMELVDGEPLSRRLARGPLPVGEAVRLGREIAEGLAAAHARGLIHRDLKPENVMVAADGRAKILDFGLAKRLEGEASLTEDQRVVGTFRSMSPEQARGRPLDARSDLFSLGLLLYEMLSGLSPFAGASTLDTLTRICVHRQAPLREVDPTIPAWLSKLVDRLLEKDPDLRPRSAREVARDLEAPVGRTAAGSAGETRVTSIESGALTLSLPASAAQASGSYSHRRSKRRNWVAGFALLVLAAAAILLWRFERPSRIAPPRSPGRSVPEAPIYIAVPKPKIESGSGDEVELFADSLRFALLRALLSFPTLRPLAPEQVDEITAKTPREIARALGVEEVVTSRIACAEGLCQISLRRVAGNDGRLLWEGAFSGSPDQATVLPEAVQGHLRIAYRGRAVTAVLGPLEVRPQDYEEYLRLRRDYDARKGNMTTERVLARLAALRQSSPRFLESFLFEAEALQQRYTEGRDPKDLERAAAVLNMARGLAPDDERPLFGEYGIDFVAGRFDEAERALSSLDRLLPGDPRVLRNRARLLEKRGDPEKALELMAVVLRRQPSSRNLFYAASMENRAGRFASARAHLIDLLERYPDQYNARSILAQIELVHGSPARAAELYKDLIRRSPETTELSNLGYAYLLQGQWADAEAAFRKALATAPNSPAVELNLADTTLLLGRGAEANALYRKVLAAASEASADPQILSIRAQALAHLGSSSAAVAATQKMLRLAPNSPQVASDVSLVYLLLGDRASALFNATWALEHGVQPRSFSAPWFSPLLSDPQFRLLLQRRTREQSL